MNCRHSEAGIHHSSFIIHHSPSWLWGLLLVACLTAVHAVFWTDMRMRAPVMPVVALAAAGRCPQPGALPGESGCMKRSSLARYRAAHVRQFTPSLNAANAASNVGSFNAAEGHQRRATATPIMRMPTLT